MTVRKRLKRRGEDGLLKCQEEHLLLGAQILDPVDQPDYGSFGFPFRDEDHRRELWETHRTRLLKVEWPKWNSEGRYPAAWWEYDSGDVRQEGETRYDFLKRIGFK